MQHVRCCTPFYGGKRKEGKWGGGGGCDQRPQPFLDLIFLGHYFRCTKAIYHFFFFFFLVHFLFV